MRREGQCQWWDCADDGAVPMVVDYRGPIFVCAPHAERVEWLTHGMFTALGFKP